MKPADAYLDVRGAKRPRDVHRAGILVRLHSHQGDQSLATARFDLANDLPRFDPVVGFVDGGNDDVHVVAKNALFVTLKGNAIQTRHRVRRNIRPPPLDHVTVVVIVGWLDQVQPERLAAFAD